MKKRLLLMMVLVTLALKGHSQSWQWAKGFGAFKYVSKASAVVSDKQGNVYVTGFFYGTTDFPPVTLIAQAPNGDSFVAKYDANGTLIWINQIKGTNLTRGTAIALSDAGNVYVCGEFTGSATFSNGKTMFSGNGSEAYTAQFDNNGTLMWATQASMLPVQSNNVARATGIAVDGSGNCYVTGNFSSSTGFNFGPSILIAKTNDVFIVKYFASSGTADWVRQGGGDQDDFSNAISSDKNRLIFITGTFSGTANFAGNKLVSNSGGYEGFVVCYDQMGTLVWTNQSNTSSGGKTVPTSITSDVNDNSYITGYFNGKTNFDAFALASTNDDGFVVAYSPSGNVTWTSQAGGTNNQHGKTLSVDSSTKSLYVAGDYINGVDFSNGPSISNVWGSYFCLYDLSGNLPFVTNASDYLFCEGITPNIGVNQSFFAVGQQFEKPVLFHNAINSLVGINLPPLAQPGLGSGYVSKYYVSSLPHGATSNPESNEGDDVSIFPNPVKDKFKFHGNTKNEMIVIRDIGGQEFYRGIIQEEMNVVSWPKGMYIITIQNEAKSQIRFSKE